MTRRIPWMLMAWTLGPGAPALAQGEAPRRFQPGKHWSGPSLLYIHVDNAARFDRRLAETLPGRIWTHPGTQRALGGLWPWLAELLAEPGAAVESATGKTPWALAGLFSGEIALSVRSVSPGRVEALGAVELREPRADALEVLSRVRSRAEEILGTSPERLAFEGGEARLWPAAWGHVVEGVVGTHHVIATTRELWDETLARFLGEGGAEVSAPLLPPDVLAAVDRPGREATFALDIGSVRNLVMSVLGQSQAARDIGRILRTLGVHRLTWLAGTAGVDDGGLRVAAHVAWKEGSGDVLDVLRKATGARSNGKEALALVPAPAVQVYSFTVDPGEIARGIRKAVEEGVTDGKSLAAELDAWVEAAIGLSPSRDLLALSRAELWGFSVAPPAGALFHDDVLLFPPGTFAAYRSLLLKLSANPEAPPERLETAAGVVECFDAGTAAAREAVGALLARRTIEPAAVMKLVLSLVGSAPAAAELAGGWTAVSDSPQSLVRLLEIHSRGPKLDLESGLGALASTRLAGASFASVSHGERALLSTYNSLLQVASAFRPLLAALRIDTTHLPPAEVFTSHARPGHVSLTIGATGLTFDAHRTPGVSQASLVAIAGSSVIAGFLVPVLLRGRGEALKVQCANNFKQLYSVMAEYSSRPGNGNAFPHSPDGSTASLQLLWNGIDDLPPALLVCPEGHESPAEAGDDGKVVLGEQNVSYATPGRRIKNTAAGAIILFDKAPHHNGRNVLFSDGSIQWLAEPEFQALLRTQQPPAAK